MIGVETEKLAKVPSNLASILFYKMNFEMQIYF
jgi:hypothetical protein